MSLSHTIPVSHQRALNTTPTQQKTKIATRQLPTTSSFTYLYAGTIRKMKFLLAVASMGSVWASNSGPDHHHAVEESVTYVLDNVHVTADHVLSPSEVTTLEAMLVELGENQESTRDTLHRQLGNETYDIMTNDSPTGRQLGNDRQLHTGNARWWPNTKIGPRSNKQRCGPDTNMVCNTMPDDRCISSSWCDPGEDYWSNGWGVTSTPLCVTWNENDRLEIFVPCSYYRTFKYCVVGYDEEYDPTFKNGVCHHTHKNEIRVHDHTNFDDPHTHGRCGPRWGGARCTARWQDRPMKKRPYNPYCKRWKSTSKKQKGQEYGSCVSRENRDNNPELIDPAYNDPTIAAAENDGSCVSTVSGFLAEQVKRLADGDDGSCQGDMSAIAATLMTEGVGLYSYPLMVAMSIPEIANNCLGFCAAAVPQSGCVSDNWSLSPTTGHLHNILAVNPGACMDIFSTSTPGSDHEKWFGCVSAVAGVLPGIKRKHWKKAFEIGPYAAGSQVAKSVYDCLEGETAGTDWAYEYSAFLGLL